MAQFVGNVRGGSLTLRQSASTSSSRVSTIPDGTALQLETCSANDWFYTTYNGQSGYVVAQYIAITNDGGVCQVDNSGSLNIRKTPSSSATRLYQAAAGSQLRLLDTTSVPNWYRVSGANGTGWAVSSYLSVVSQPSSSSSLSLGDEGAEVSAVQEKLMSKHYYFGHSDGVFDTRTEWAVKYFQDRNSLTVDGIVGPATSAKLNDPDAVIGVSTNVVDRVVGGPAEPNIKMNNPIWTNVVWDANNTSETETIGTSGNAPTAVAIMFSTMWENAITPPVIAQWAKNANLRDETGTKGVVDSFFTRVASEWQVAYEGTDKNTANYTLAEMQNYLNQGGLMLVRLTNHGAGSAYTNGATYVVIYKIDSSGVHVENSNAGSNATISTAAWNAGRDYWIHEVHRYRFVD